MMVMSYIETLHPRGQAANAGQFRAKGNAAPTDVLAAVAVPTANLWVVEGDDHEMVSVEARTEEEALDLAADEFADRYGSEPNLDVVRVVGAFAGDMYETNELVFIPTGDASNEAVARRALDHC